MSTRVIYHDFRKVQSPDLSVMLTAQVLSKGRRLIKAVNKLNTAINGACLFLCGACMGVSILILAWLAIGG